MHDGLFNPRRWPLRGRPAGRGIIRGAGNDPRLFLADHAGQGAARAVSGRALARKFVTRRPFIAVRRFLFQLRAAAHLLIVIGSGCHARPFREVIARNWL